MAQSMEILQSRLKQVAQATVSLSEGLASQKNLIVASQSPEDQLQHLLSLKDASIQAPRIALIDACRQLLELAVGPVELLETGIPISIQFNSAMAAIVHFNFAAHVPQTGSIAVEDLARSVKLHPERVKRVLRCAVAHRVFLEEPLGFIAHNRTSRALLHPGRQAWLGHQFEEMLPASAKLVDAFEMYPRIEDDRETAFSIAFSGDRRKSYWEVLEQNPEKVKRFCDALEYICTTGGAGDFRPLVKCYEWKKFGSCKLVDVGGSTGRVSIAIAEAADPGMQFVVQDLAEVEMEALNTIPAKLQGKITFQAHDFFQEQPVKDAHVYMYRQILHDWPDGKAIEILKALAPALDPGDYLLLVETVQPDPETLPNSIERLIYATDLLMMAKHNSKERTLGMWKELLLQADTRFQLQRVVSPQDAGAQGAIIEVRWMVD